MNDAVWKFRSYEEPSLHYRSGEESQTTMGGWSVRRDERFARLVDAELLKAGDSLNIIRDASSITALITTDYGIAIDGVRHESPDSAAVAATGEKLADGWALWGIDNRNGVETLKDLELRLRSSD